MTNLFARQSNLSVRDNSIHVFILGLVDILAPLPFEIIPEHFVHRAPLDFIEFFKELLNMVRPFPLDYFLYERSPVQTVPGEPKGHISYVSEELPPEKWKYWIVSHNGNNHEIQYLQQASLLLKDEIEFGFTIGKLAGRPVTSFGSPEIASYLTDDPFTPRTTVQITVDDLKSVWENYSLIKELKPEYAHIKNAVRLFNDLRALPRSSDFVIIGLFSIIESLISHSPQLDFHHDSIVHQVQTKIHLLRKRFPRKLDYSEFFSSAAKEETILSKLYAYRSEIVHTGTSIMSPKISQVLTGKKETKAFLMELTKQLLVIALKEPELVTDLKSC